MTNFTPKETVDYVWKWFEFHAKQRTTMFNYFIVFSILFINAIISLIAKGFAKDSPVILFILIFIGIIITLIFCGIDHRNKKLLSAGEDVLINMEKLFIFKELINNDKNLKIHLIDRNGEPLNHFGLLLREREENENEKPISINKITKHSILIPAIQYLLIATYLLIMYLILMYGADMSVNIPK